MAGDAGLGHGLQGPQGAATAPFAILLGRARGPRPAGPPRGASAASATPSASTMPSVRFEYTPPDDSERRDSTRWRCPSRCPRSPCVTRLLGVLQECADGFGAWPSGRWVSSVLCPGVLLLQLWALAFCALGSGANVDGQLFHLVAMFVCAKLAGWMVRRLADMPALVGMLIVGVAMKNTGALELDADFLDLVAVLRQVALAVIMLQAGLGLDPAALRSLSLLVLGLALVPAVVEVGAVVVLAYLLLDLPWLWGLLLGLVLAAVAPSVVMPCFTQLRAQRLGVDKGIDTLVIAAASLDDVIAISLYGLVHGLIFSEGSSVEELIQHPLGLVFGVLHGVVLGKALQWVPTRDARHLALWRFVLVLGGGLGVMFGSDALGFHEAGSVGCIATALVAAAGWRARESALSVHEVEKMFEMLWSVFEPIMFSLIGADINTTVLDGGMVGLAVGCILISLLFRSVSTWVLLLAGKRFNWKERLFVALAWLPKADVQAALGPLALDTARHLLEAQQGPGSSSSGGAVEDVARANTVLLVAVLSILITAPAGSAIIASLSRRLLQPNNQPNNDGGDPSEGQDRDGRLEQGLGGDQGLQGLQGLQGVGVIRETPLALSPNQRV